LISAGSNFGINSRLHSFPPEFLFSYLDYGADGLDVTFGCEKRRFWGPA
jgi:hypothetical protein